MKKNRIAILCGGRGKRLGNLTDNFPKPLIPLQGKPILAHILENFIRKGFDDFILCTGYQGERIKEFIGKYGEGAKATFSFSCLGSEVSILQRIHALKTLFNDRIFCTYGDTVTDLDMDGLFKDHLDKKAPVTITSSRIKNPFGLLEIDAKGWASAFVEKPTFTYYIGHLLLEKRAFDLIEPKMLEMSDGKGLVAFFQKLIKRKWLNVFEHYGAQITFNTQVELVNANGQMVDFYSQKEMV